MIQKMCSSRVCPICGKEFQPRKYNHTYCNRCKQNRRSEIYQYINDNRKPKPKKVSKRIKTIGDICESLKNYNRENGTCLSYGQYVRMLEIEEIDI